MAAHIPVRCARARRHCARPRRRSSPRRGDRRNRLDAAARQPPQQRRRPTAAPVDAETRTLPQQQADALATLCRHAPACENSAPGLAATIRRMAAEAEVIPCVLGGDSEILDFGRARRLFSRAQKLALVERDGGCALPQ